jgi:mono/diheme cytochrome c family protein
MTMRIAISVIGAVLALTTLPARAGDVDDGAGYFREFCATCHGIEASGNGPMAGVLVIKPTDLTTLSARIDGRDPLVSHGSPMPVFGRFFEGRDVTVKTPDGQPVMTSRPVADLLAYLQTLQAL